MNEGRASSMESRFAFGKNWSDYARTVDDEAIAAAEEGLTALLERPCWAGMHVADIGCGSGVHALGMLRLGAASVTAVDYDLASVATTRALLEAHAPAASFETRRDDILNTALPVRAFDIVYSWGVLHHTGDMWRAIANAAERVADGGLFILAIYKKTPLCGFWKAEKRIFTRLPGFAQSLIVYGFGGTAMLARLAAGKPVFGAYKKRRGMNFWIDQKDWLGGYPYESATPEQIVAYLSERGFEHLRSAKSDPAPLGGIFGSGCAEFVFRRNAAPNDRP